MKKNKNKILLCVFSIFAAIICVCLFLILNYAKISSLSNEKIINDSSEKKLQENKNEGKNDDETIQIPKVPNIDDEINEKVENILNKMTMEEKVGQLFIVDLEALDSNSNCTQFNDSIKEHIQNYNVGGVIYFSDNLISREQVIELNNDFQENSKIQMFISIDEEGGEVSRIANNPSMGTTKFSSMRTIGDSNDINKAYEVGVTIGSDINKLGFNVDFAPDADIITNANNTEIGNRSFGTNAELVAKMVPKVIQGLHESNVCATLKHFPGHGGSEANSHNEFSYTPQNLDGLRQVEFLPFKAGIEEDADFILVSHIAVPNVTNNNIPSSLNEVIVNDILRKELDYKNIIITDALNMKAISNYYTSEEASLAAIKAGADMLLMPSNLDEAYSAVIESCNDGTISEGRLNESVRRILKTKVKREII